VEGKGQADNSGRIEVEHHGQHAEQAGLNQRIDEHGLKGRSQDGKREAYQCRRKNARQADFDQDAVQQTHAIGEIKGASKYF
jgi:hypothetical protein